ncbi:MAG: hypothetical protein M3036_12100, partial [Bifidobacteriales bacterium]|nr:hypothetical protein [Bifidobacteriales bacterium]
WCQIDCIARSTCSEFAEAGRVIPGTASYTDPARRPIDAMEKVRRKALRVFITFAMAVSALAPAVVARIQYGSFPVTSCYLHPIRKAVQL